MAIDPDAYAIWGDWDLEQFKVQVARWVSATRPPQEVMEIVKHWWPTLKQPKEWSSAQRVIPDLDPGGNLRWMWVPRGSWIDDNRSHFRVQCLFRVHEEFTPPRLVCDEFRSVQATTPDGIDRMNRMNRMS